MEITEKDVEDLIFEDLMEGGGDLNDRGFCPFLVSKVIPNKIYWSRQVQLPGYGIADIIGFARFAGIIYVDIYELKNKPIKSEDFDQVLRYKTAVREFFYSLPRRPLSHIINCSLIGPSIETGHYIHNNSSVQLFTFNYSIRGFEFEHRAPGWHRPDAKVNLKTISLENFYPVEPAPTPMTPDFNTILETLN